MNPSTMTPLQTLLMVWATGGVLSREGDHLHVEAPQGEDATRTPGGSAVQQSRATHPPPGPSTLG